MQLSFFLSTIKNCQEPTLVFQSLIPTVEAEHLMSWHAQWTDGVRGLASLRALEAGPIFF